MTTTEARKHLPELVNMAALRPIEGSRWSHDTPVAVNLPWQPTASLAGSGTRPY